MKLISTKKYSLNALLFIFVFIISVSTYFNLWKSNRIVIDAPSYYAFLPAVFIHHDLHLSYIDKDRAFYQDKVWYLKIANGNKLIKHPVGLSITLSPFFLLAHITASIFSSPQHGYSLLYQNFMSAGVLIYLLIGLFYLRKLLLFFFDEKIVALTLISIAIGTNLLWYATFEGLMSHTVSFSLLCICLYMYKCWLSNSKQKYLILFFIFFGLSVAIRPLAVTLAIYFLLWGLTAKGGIKNFIEFLRPQVKPIVIGSILFLLITSLQLCYWKYITGQWYYNIYQDDEHFVFSSPQIIPFLFSFRKGLFIYTPVMLFAIIGLLKLYRTHRDFFYSTLVIFCSTVFLLSSWWAWSYGICWGMRPMIDYYAILSMPMAAAFSLFINKSNWAKKIIYAIVAICIALNLFQTWQYKNGLIHYDDMSRKAYFKGFLQTKANDEWLDLLEPYDWDRRLQNLPQIEYNKQTYNALNRNQKISLRGSNLHYITVNKNASNMMASLAESPGNSNFFYIEHLQNDTVCIRSLDGYLWTVNTHAQNAITASAEKIGMSEKFVVEYPDADDNHIALKSFNGFYISTDNKWPFIIRANGIRPEKQELFRYFITSTMP